MGKKQTVVCVFAHPDDEAFGPAGTIAKFARFSDVYIISVTNGDADAQFTKHDSEKLGAVRQLELRNSAKILGVKAVEFLGYKDGSLCNNLYHKLAADIKAKLEKYQPDTVITFEPQGVSGHIDHIAVSFVTTYVFYRLESVKRLWLFCVSRQHIAKVKKYFGDYFVYFPPGYRKPEIDLRVDTTKYWDERIRAIKAHISQKEDAEKILRILSELPKEEYFLVKAKKAPKTTSG